jgi:hypothetical protein
VTALNLSPAALRDLLGRHLVEVHHHSSCALRACLNSSITTSSPSGM